MMSAEAVEEIINRAGEDETFRHLLEREPEKAMHGYDVSYAERAALIAGDAAKLQQLGVSPEASRRAAEYNGEPGGSS